MRLLSLPEEQEPIPGSWEEAEPAPCVTSHLSLPAPCDTRQSDQASSWAIPAMGAEIQGLGGKKDRAGGVLSLCSPQELLHGVEFPLAPQPCLGECQTLQSPAWCDLSLFIGTALLPALVEIPQLLCAQGLPAPPPSASPAPDAAPLLIASCNLRDCYLLIDCSEPSKVHYLKQEAERDPEEQMDAWKYQKKE